MTRESSAPENGVRRLLSNSSWLAAAQLISKVASLALVVILARKLGARSYGYFAFALAFLPLFFSLANLGVDAIVIREVASNRDALSDVFVNAAALRVTLAFAALLIGLAAIPLLVRSTVGIEAVAILGGALWLDDMSTFFAAVFEAFERMRFTATVLLVNRVLSTGLAVVVVAAGGGLVAVCVTYLIGSLGALLCAALAFLRYFPRVKRRDMNRRTRRRLLRSGAPYGLANFFNFGAFRIDTVILQAIKGPVQVAYYGVAYRFFEPLLFAAWGLSDAAMPRMVRSSRDRRPDRTFEMVLAALAAFYLPVAAAAPFAGAWLVTKLFGSSYRPVADAVTWLTAALAFYAIAHLARIALISGGHSRLVAGVAASTLGTNIGANLVIIPHFGFTGAAAVTFLTEVVEACLLCGIYLHRSGNRIRLAGPIAAPIGAAAALAGSLELLGLRGKSAIAVGILVYVVVLACLAKLLAGEELRTVRGALGRGTGGPPGDAIVDIHPVGGAAGAVNFCDEPPLTSAGGEEPSV